MTEVILRRLGFMLLTILRPQPLRFPEPILSSLASPSDIWGHYLRVCRGQE